MKTTSGALKAALWVAVLAIAFASLTLLSATSNTANAQASPNGSQATTVPDPMEGFWYVNLTANNGALIDWGFQQFHSDGTEVLNSGSGPKKICFGVWGKEKGTSTYIVNHFPIAYAGNAFAGPVHLREEFTLSPDHNNFTGTFTLDVYNVTASTVLAHIVGKIGGKRVTVNTSLDDLLPMPPLPLAP